MEPEELRRVIAVNIRRLADAKGISLNHVADRAGLARRAFYRVLSLDASPTADTLAKLSAVFEVPPRELLDERKVEQDED